MKPIQERHGSLASLRKEELINEVMRLRHVIRLLKKQYRLKKFDDKMEKRNLAKLCKSDLIDKIIQMT